MTIGKMSCREREGIIDCSHLLQVGMWEGTSTLKEHTPLLMETTGNLTLGWCANQGPIQRVAGQLLISSATSLLKHQGGKSRRGRFAVSGHRFIFLNKHTKPSDECLDYISVSQSLSPFT